MSVNWQNRPGEGRGQARSPQVHSKVHRRLRRRGYRVSVSRLVSAVGWQINCGAGRGDKRPRGRAALGGAQTTQDAAGRELVRTAVYLPPRPGVALYLALQGVNVPPRPDGVRRSARHPFPIGHPRHRPPPSRASLISIQHQLGS